MALIQCTPFSQIYKIYISSLVVVFFFAFSFYIYIVKFVVKTLPRELQTSGVAAQARGPRSSSVLVPLHVQGQVVGAGEAAVAHPALERLGPGVLPVVARQLVRAREPPVAAFPGAFVRLLTSMSPQVSF